MTTATAFNYCIALQPICDGTMTHVADELLYRAHGKATAADVHDHQTATARVCNIAFYETGLANLVGSRKIFVNIPEEWILDPKLLPPAPEQIVIEVLETVAGTPEIISALQRIRALGYRIALDDFVPAPDNNPLLDVADIVKIDVSQPIDHAWLERLKASGTQLLAEKVEDLDTFNRMRDLGFQLFQGYFYARPETLRLTARTRTNNHPALMRLLNEMRQPDADYKQLENLIAQDAQLTYVLLKYANSALLHHRGEILTIAQALNALGLRRVQAIAISILLANNGPASRLLLTQALVRATMCELLAERHSQSPEVAFTVGLISMMGPLLDESLEALISKLPISQDAEDAILRRHHTLGRILTSVEQFELGQIDDWPSGKVDEFNRLWLESRVWTTQTLTGLENTI